MSSPVNPTWYSYKVPGVKISPPRVRVLDTPTKHYWCGQVTSTSVNSVTATLRLVQHIIGTRTFLSALAPTAVPGDPACFEVTGNGANNYTVVAVHRTGFIDSHSGSQAEAVARGDFWPGFVPQSLGGHD